MSWIFATFKNNHVEYSRYVLRLLEGWRGFISHHLMLTFAVHISYYHARERFLPGNE